MAEHEETRSLRALLDAAETLVERDGWDALSMASLARELGVQPPSLYKHVQSLDDLRRRLGLRGVRHMAEVLRTSVLGRSGDDALAAMTHAFRDWVLAHPGRYAAQSYLARRDDIDYWEAAGRATEAATAVLTSYRLDDEATRRAIVMIWGAVHGFVTIEASGALDGYVDVEAAFADLVGALTEGIHNQESRGGSSSGSVTDRAGRGGDA